MVLFKLRAIVKGHLPAKEGDHFGASGLVGRSEGGAFQSAAHGGDSWGFGLDSAGFGAKPQGLRHEAPSQRRLMIKEAQALLAEPCRRDRTQAQSLVSEH